MSSTTPGSQATLRRQLGVLFVQEEMFSCQSGSVSDTDPAQKTVKHLFVNIVLILLRSSEVA